MRKKKKKNIHTLHPRAVAMKREKLAPMELPRDHKGKKGLILNIVYYIKLYASDSLCCLNE